MRVLISNMQASRVNLLQNHFAAGIPSITAFMGLGATIMHELGFGRHDVRVLPIIHDIQASLGRTRSEMGNKSSRWTPQEIFEDLHGSVVFSMIMDIPEVRDLQDIVKTLDGKRLAGGIILPQYREKGIEAKEVVASGACFKRMQRGRIIMPLEHCPVSFGDIGTLWPVTDAYLPLPISEKSDSTQTSSRGYRVPIAIGYRLLGDINEVPPNGARDHVTPHTFAEPGVSVAELVSVRNPRLTEADEELVETLFYRWSSFGDHIAVHPYYNPSIED